MKPQFPFARSEELWARAQAVIPLGTQTLSKSPTQFVQGAHPIFLTSGSGAHVFDADGNEWIDEPMALGPVILGYAEPVIDEAISRQLRDGITFTMMHPLEVEVAERIVAMCPGVEMVRFAKSGSDALSGAVRAARAITGRDHVIVTGYHGWHDWFIGSTSRWAGVPKAVRSLVHPIRFGDPAELAAVMADLREKIAAVVVEPCPAEPPPPGYLQHVVDVAAEAGALSVFDEVITGFRVAPGGARQRYGVIPDISCYGKALGNGMPISAIAGSHRVMKVFEEIFFSGTHGGEALSLAAARALLDTISDGTVLGEIEERGRNLMDGVSALIERHGVGELVTIAGEPHHPVMTFGGADPLITKSWTQQCQAAAGCLFNGSLFVCARHTDADIRQMLDGFDRAFAAMSDDGDLPARLVGPPVSPVFREP